MGKLKSLLMEVLMAVAPMIAIILILMFITVGFDGRLLIKFFFGAAFVVAGMTLFLFGAEYSMMQVGELVGSYLMHNGKIIMALVCAFVIGTAITLAEPDVQVLAKQLKAITDGAISPTMLTVFIGVGVGLFVVASLAVIIFQKNLITALLIGYALLFLVAIFLTPNKYVPVSFDAGGVTTGPITVPFIMAFAAGATASIGNKKGGESFGMVGLASVGPILAVLILGVMNP